ELIRNPVLDLLRERVDPSAGGAIDLPSGGVREVVEELGGFLHDEAPRIEAEDLPRRRTVLRGLVAALAEQRILRLPPEIVIAQRDPSRARGLGETDAGDVVVPCLRLRRSHEGER